MKKRYLLINIALLIGCQTTLANGLKELPFVERINKQVNFAEQQTVWPGFHPASTPIIINFDNQESSVAYGINFKNLPQPWQKISDSIHYIEDASSLNLSYDDGIVALVNEENAFIDRERSSYLSNESIYNKVLSNRVLYYLMNESKLIDHKHSDLMNIAYDDFYNSMLVKLTYLEISALIAAQQNDAIFAEEALRDAVAIHQYRHSLSSTNSVRYENGLELIYGLQSFISLQLQQLNPDNYRKMTQRHGCLPLDVSYGVSGIISCLASGYAFFASPIYGQALERKLIGSSWKRDVEIQFKPMSEIIINYYAFSIEKAKQLTVEAMKKPQYDYKRIEKIIDFMLPPYVATLNAIKERYHQQQGIEFRTNSGIPFLLLILKMSNPNVYKNSYALNVNQRLFEELNFPKPEQERSTFMSFTHFPFISSTQVYNNFKLDLEQSYSSFMLDMNTEVMLDGKKYLAKDLLNNQVVQMFHTIEISEPRMSLKQNMKQGRLDTENGIITFKEMDHLEDRNS